MSGNAKDKHTQEAYFRGVRLYFNGQYDLALAELSAPADSERPISRMARYYRALCHRGMAMAHMHRRRYDAAAERFKQAIDEAGPSLELSRYLAASYALAGQPDRTAGELESAAGRNDGQVAVHVALAQAQWQAGRRVEAQMTLTAAMRRFGGDARLHLQRGLFHSAEDRWAEARNAFAKAVEADRGAGRAWHYLGLTHAAMGDPVRAAEAFQNALQRDPKNLMVAYQLSLAARAAAQAGMELTLRPPAPDDPQAALRRGDMAHYITSEPDLLDALLAFTDPAEDAGRLHRLLATLRVASRQCPTYADLHYYCSRVLAKLGDHDRALHQARRAVDRNPRFVRGLLHLGSLYAADGQGRQAAECYRQAIRCGADWPDVHCRLGELIGADDTPTAVTHLKRALELKPDYSRATRALQTIAA